MCVTLHLTKLCTFYINGQKTLITLQLLVIYHEIKDSTLKISSHVVQLRHKLLGVKSMVVT